MSVIKLGPTQCVDCDSLVTEVPGGQWIKKIIPGSKWIIYEDTTQYSCPKCGIVKGIYFKNLEYFPEKDKLKYVK